MAKQLLRDTALPIASIAQLSGFASQRRFNTAFASHYRLTPLACRREGQAVNDVRLTLAYRPPHDDAALLKFLGQRAVPGLELCTSSQDSTSEFVRIVRLSVGARSHLGWVRVHFEAAANRVHVRLGDSLLPVLPAVLQQVRWALDLDADPLAIEAVLARDFAHCTGWRVPGAWDGFELAVRAVLGQQVTVAAARTLTRRLVQTLGEPLTTPWPQLTHAFPTPAVLLQASVDDLGQMGIVRQRQKAIQAFAHAVLHGGLELTPGPKVQATVRKSEGLCRGPHAQTGLADARRCFAKALGVTGPPMRVGVVGTSPDSALAAVADHIPRLPKVTGKPNSSASGDQSRRGDPSRHYRTWRRKPYWRDEFATAAKKSSASAPCGPATSRPPI